MSKKESFIKGTLILAAAALVARVLGIFQKVPLEHMFDDIGNAAFAQANNIYLMLLTIATAGIPSTLSKMVSERYALNRPGEARQVYRAALIFAVVAGGVISLALYISAPLVARLAGVPESALAIRAIAPALLLFPAIAMMRGYFQGRNNMMAGGVSQIVEQVARVALAIGLAYLLLRQGYDNTVMAAGASFGSVFGSLAAFAVMLYFSVKLRKTDKAELLNASPAKLPLFGIYRDIFTLSIPIVIASMTIQAVYFIDTTMLVPLMKGLVGLEAAQGLLANLGQKAQSVAGIPPVLAIALSTSLIPVISAAFARKDEEHLKRQMTLAMRIAILTGVPIVLSLVVASRSVNGLLFKDMSGTDLIALLTFGTIFQITMMTSNSILLGMGKSRISMNYVLIGIATKLVGSLILSRFIGVYGIIVSTALCFIVITLLNVRLLKSIVPFEVMGKKWGSFLLAALISSAAGFGLNQAGSLLTALMPDRIAYLITCLAVGGTVVVLYLVLLVVLGTISREELAAYPRPLQKALRPLMRLQPARVAGKQ